MKMRKAAYWISTGLLCLFYIAGAISYLTQRSMVEEGFVWLGYPGYLINVLIVVKIAAPLVLLSRVSVRLSDIAYSGMFFHLLLAASAHLNKGDGGFVPAFVGLALLVVSFLTQNAARKKSSPNASSFA